MRGHQLQSDQILPHLFVRATVSLNYRTLSSRCCVGGFCSWMGRPSVCAQPTIGAAVELVSVVVFPSPRVGVTLVSATVSAAC